MNILVLDVPGKIRNIDIPLDYLFENTLFQHKQFQITL